MTKLCDADYLLHSSCSACEADIRWTEDIHTLHLDQGDVKDLIGTMLDRYEQITGDSDVVMCFSDYPTFRHEEHQDYKANRVGRRKPLGYRDLRMWMMDNFESRVLPGLEADDVMGLLSTNGTVDSPVIVSPDKDMRTIPGRLLAKDEVELITQWQADRAWMMQTLTGDSSDNYPGLKGVGPKGAEKILGDSVTLKDMWPKVVAAFQKAGLTLNDAVLNARLARILRDGDYDLKAGRVLLWDPSTDPCLTTNG
jgi:DNA polymerase-1